MTKNQDRCNGVTQRDKRKSIMQAQKKEITNDGKGRNKEIRKKRNKERKEGRKKERQEDRKTERQTDRQTERKKGRKKERKTESNKERTNRKNKRKKEMSQSDQNCIQEPLHEQQSGPQVVQKRSKWRPKALPRPLKRATRAPKRSKVSPRRPF